MSRLLFRSGDPWTEATLRDTLDACQDIAYNDLGLSLFPNQVIMCSEAGMLDAYGTGLPHRYPHWSFGKRAKELELARKNGMGLALEMVIPTNPCISWNLASNSAGAMALVLAHAAVGHNAVYKNNYLYQQHTDTDDLADYSLRARNAILEFERRFGVSEVEKVLDACHALENCGIFRHGTPQPFDAEKEKQRIADYMRSLEQSFDASIAETVPQTANVMRERPSVPEKHIEFPQENVLWFVETYAPKLLSWQREVIRIVRTLAQQMVLPGAQMKIVHEGMASFCHHYIPRKLYEQGRLDDGTYLEMFHLDQSVLYQPDMRDTGRLSATHNPYAFGYGMFKDMLRITGFKGDDVAFFRDDIDLTGPSDEDRAFFGKRAGTGQWRDVIQDAIANYNDSTFIQQFLSPRRIRDMGLFTIKDEGEHYRVTNVSDYDGYDNIRQMLARAHSFDGIFPQITVVGADLDDDRTLKLEFKQHDDLVDLHDEETEQTTQLLEQLWGYDVELETV